MDSQTSSYKDAIRAALETVETRRNQREEDEDVVDEQGSDDSSSEEEDEYGEELTPAMDAAILKTLSMIRRGDGVYGSEKVIEGEIDLSSCGKRPKLQFR